MARDQSGCLNTISGLFGDILNRFTGGLQILTRALNRVAGGKQNGRAQKGGNDNLFHEIAPTQRLGVGPGPAL
jgi:hypothetical protein